MTNQPHSRKTRGHNTLERHECELPISRLESFGLSSRQIAALTYFINVWDGGALQEIRTANVEPQGGKRDGRTNFNTTDETKYCNQPVAHFTKIL